MSMTKKVILLLAAIGVGAFTGVYFGVLSPQSAPHAETITHDTPHAQKQSSAPQMTDHEQTSLESMAGIDVEAALSERILGNPNAPVKISEHASLTCSHCGHFHKDTFKKIKENYIDTGKAYLVFSDFPLNGPALKATMIARCLPEDQYFDFISFLFEEQAKWAFDSNYMNFLKHNAVSRGMSEATFNACESNQALQEGIVARLKASQKQWNINSTPSFVLNNHKTVSGAMSYEEFAKLIDEELAGASEPQTDN